MYKLIGISCGSDFLLEICKIEQNVEIQNCVETYIYGNSDCLRYVKKIVLSLFNWLYSWNDLT